MAAEEHEVVVAGGGPTGMMLAAELKLAGIDAAIVERRVTQELDGSRARGLHSRTIEVLDQRGIADRFIEAGEPMQVQGYAQIALLDISDFPTRHPYGLALMQSRFEEILAGWVEELGVPVLRGRELSGFAQDEAGVDVELEGGDAIRAQYLVGCDGGRSVVRKAAGIEFPGWEPTVSHLLAEARLAKTPEEWGIHRNEHGISALSPPNDDGVAGVMVTEREVGTAEPTLEDLSEELVAAYGTDFGIHSPTWLTRFTDATRQAATYRAGRVLLAGDAAHIHYPASGQGLGIGVQDAVNLGWKLAQVVNGTSSPALLDTYEAERHPVAAAALQSTMAQTALMRSDPRVEALRGVVADLLGTDEARRRYGAMLAGLDIHYDRGEGHPLLGRRLPDLELATADGPRRLYCWLHEARPLLLDLGAAGGLAESLAPWADRVQLVEATYDGPWELPVLGPVTAPAAVFVRPDGYVGWVAEQAGIAGLEDALAAWCGPPAGFSARRPSGS
jgi:3-(3-hydroxy-phenyl)propionate hydroxylase